MRNEPQFYFTDTQHTSAHIYHCRNRKITNAINAFGTKTRKKEKQIQSKGSIIIIIGFWFCVQRISRWVVCECGTMIGKNYPLSAPLDDKWTETVRFHQKTNGKPYKLTFRMSSKSSAYIWLLLSSRDRGFLSANLCSPHLISSWLQ